MTRSQDGSAKSSLALVKAERHLRDFCMTYPETIEEFPWGHRAMKVRGKGFVFLALDGEVFSVSVKLPGSNMAALMFPFTSPTGYGLGRSGWVTARFEKGDEVPLEILESWIDESFRAIAPKRIVKQLGDEPEPARPAPKK